MESENTPCPAYCTHVELRAIPAKTRQSNAVLMLANSLLRWPSIKTSFCRSLLFTGWAFIHFLCSVTLPFDTYITSLSKYWFWPVNDQQMQLLIQN